MVPFDGAKLERLMGEAGADLLLVHTRHNIRYLTGGYFYHFHSRFTAMGRSQYLPLLGLPRGRWEDAFYVGTGGEWPQFEDRGVWVKRREESGRGTIPAAEKAAEAIRGLGLEGASIALERSFLPADAAVALARALPRARFPDATPILDELRAIKSQRELDLLRRVYGLAAEAIYEAFRAGKPGMATEAIAQRVQEEMVRRGLSFLYVFTCAGPSFYRAPSARRWERGRVLHIDAGGTVDDYMADLCRMGALGEPGPLARELHKACLEVQERARAAIRPGLPCKELQAAGERAVKETPFAQCGNFIAHGIGMISHEAPVVDSNSTRPLESGMVLSIETEFHHPEVGHVKIEDAVAVTETGCEGLGDLGRELQVVGG